MMWIWYFTIILAPFNQNSLGYYMLASYEHKLVWYFTIILALFIQNSLYWYDGQWPSYDVNMVFHHTFGTIHLKQLVLVWWSVTKLWREYGISPSSWHHSSKTAYDTISWNTAQMCLKLRSQIGSKPICPFIHKVGSPQPCSALLFAKPLTDHCKAEIFILCWQA